MSDDARTVACSCKEAKGTGSLREDQQPSDLAIPQASKIALAATLHDMHI